MPDPDINAGDQLEIEGSSYETRTVRRLVKQAEPWTIIKKSDEVTSA